MKRIAITSILLCLVLALTAQSNHNGVWYSLYDDSNHTMNTQGDYSTSNTYAPTAGTLNVKWKYS